MRKLNPKDFEIADALVEQLASAFGLVLAEAVPVVLEADHP